MPDARGRDQLEDRVQHPQTRAQDRHDDDVARDAPSLCRPERRLDRGRDARNVPRGLGREQQADPDGHPPKELGRRGGVPQRRERVVNERMRDEVQRHGFTIQEAGGRSRSRRRGSETRRGSGTDSGIGARARCWATLIESPLMLLRVCACRRCAAVAAGAAERRTVSLIVSGGTVVTMDPAGRVLSPGALAIDGRDIVGVDTPEAIAARFSARETVDATGQVVLPGLINTHTHAPMVLYRGLADDLALMEWLEKYIFPAEAKTVTPEFVRAGTRLAALEMIQSGTTTYADMYYFEEEIARVTKEAGLRGVLGQTIIQFPVPDAKTPAEALARTEAFIKEFAGDELIVPALAPHSMYTLDTATLKAIRALADRDARAGDHPPGGDGGRNRNRADAPQGDPGAVPGIHRLLGSADPGRARRLAVAR